MCTEVDELWSCAQTRSQERGKRMEGKREEKKKIILKGFGLSLFPLPSLTPSHSGYSPPPLTLTFPYNFSILSGDFQREMVEIKDFNSSDVSATCHMRRKKHTFAAFQTLLNWCSTQRGRGKHSESKDIMQTLGWRHNTTEMQHQNELQISP